MNIKKCRDFFQISFFYILTCSNTECNLSVFEQTLVSMLKRMSRFFPNLSFIYSPVQTQTNYTLCLNRVSMLKRISFICVGHDVKQEHSNAQVCVRPNVKCEYHNVYSCILACMWDLAQWSDCQKSNPTTPGFDPLAGQGEGQFFYPSESKLVWRLVCCAWPPLHVYGIHQNVCARQRSHIQLS